MTLATETDPNVIRAHLFGLYLGAPYGKGTGHYLPSLVRSVSGVVESVHMNHKNAEKRAALAERVQGAIVMIGSIETDEARTCRNFLSVVRCLLLSDSPVYLRACAQEFGDASRALREFAIKLQTADQTQMAAG